MTSTMAVDRPDNTVPTTKPRWYRQLYFWVIVAIIAGVLVGWLAPGFGKAMEPVGTGFIALLRVLIGPIVFLTIISGIAGVADLRRVGLTGSKPSPTSRWARSWPWRSAYSRSTSSRWATGSTPTQARSRFRIRSTD